MQLEVLDCSEDSVFQYLLNSFLAGILSFIQLFSNIQRIWILAFHQSFYLLLTDVDVEWNSIVVLSCFHISFANSIILKVRINRFPETLEDVVFLIWFWSFSSNFDFEQANEFVEFSATLFRAIIRSHYILNLLVEYILVPSAQRLGHDRNYISGDVVFISEFIVSFNKLLFLILRESILNCKLAIKLLLVTVTFGWSLFRCRYLFFTKHILQNIKYCGFVFFTVSIFQGIVLTCSDVHAILSFSQVIG